MLSADTSQAERERWNELHATSPKDAYRFYLQTEHWKRRRRQILERDSHQCQACGDKSPLHVHHKRYTRLWREADVDLVTLCSGCHSATHDGGKISRIVSKRTGERVKNKKPQRTQPTNQPASKKKIKKIKQQKRKLTKKEKLALLTPEECEARMEQSRRDKERNRNRPHPHKLTADERRIRREARKTRYKTLAAARAAHPHEYGLYV